MKKILISTLLFALLLSTNASTVQASAASDSDSITARAKALKTQSSSQALDVLVEAGLSQDPQIRTMINEWGDEVYSAAMNGTGVFDKETGDVYLKKHASLIKNGFAQSCLNEIALRSSRRYNDETGRRYLEDRFTNHNDADAGQRLNVASLEGLRGFTEQTGLEYLEQQVKRYMEPEALGKLTGEAYDKQTAINTAVQDAIDKFIEFKYKPTLPADEISVGYEWSIDRPPTVCVYVPSIPRIYPAKTLFQTHAPRLFVKAREQYIQKLSKGMEEKIEKMKAGKK